MLEELDDWVVRGSYGLLVTLVPVAQSLSTSALRTSSIIQVVLYVAAGLRGINQRAGVMLGERKELERKVSK